MSPRSTDLSQKWLRNTRVRMSYEQAIVSFSPWSTNNIATTPRRKPRSNLIPSWLVISADVCQPSKSRWTSDRAGLSLGCDVESWKGCSNPATNNKQELSVVDSSLLLLCSHSSSVSSVSRDVSSSQQPASTVEHNSRHNIYVYCSLLLECLAPLHGSPYSVRSYCVLRDRICAG